MTNAEKFYEAYLKVPYDYELDRKDWNHWGPLMNKIRDEAIMSIRFLRA